jgi:putative zinc finger/helix-turn-helix YgiT family protein
MNICPSCNEPSLTVGTTTLSRTVCGVEFSAVVPAQICPCGESLVHSDHLGGFERAAASWLAHNTAPSGEALRFMRAAIGLQQKRFAESLGITPEHLSRCEHGKHEVDRRIYALLGVIVDEHAAGNAATLDRLDALARAGGPIPSAAVVLDVA